MNTTKEGTKGAPLCLKRWLTDHGGELIENGSLENLHGFYHKPARADTSVELTKTGKVVSKVQVEKHSG